MTPLFNKLNFKGQTEVVVLGAPASFERELDALRSVTVHRDAAALERVEFALAFVSTGAQLQAAADAILPKAQGDAVVWLAYPKGTSKRYRSEINRDSGWVPPASRACGRSPSTRIGPPCAFAAWSTSSP
jgi:hypothetical protein